MRIGAHRVTANWGHVAFATFLLLLCVAYLYDSVSKSTNIQNLLFVLPATLLAVLLYLVVMAQEIRIRPATEAVPPGAGLPSYKVPAMMALVGLYVAGLAYVGFDVSTFLFIAGSLAVQGERRPMLLLVYPAVFTALTVWGMEALSPYVIPTVLL